MANFEELPDYKIKILTALAEYKYLTSKQVWDKTGAAMDGKSYAQTRVELFRLKKAGLIRLESVKGERGRTGQQQWLLQRAGAQLINFEKFGKHYLRELSRDQTDYHKLEIDLEEQIDLALGDWHLVKRQPVSSSHRLPETTEQYFRLCQVLAWQEYQKTGVFPDDATGPHMLMVPRKTNHHLAYHADHKHAVLLLLPRPRATERFWQSRKKDYGRLANKIPILGVFPGKKELKASEKVLEKFSFKGVTVGQVSGLLSEIAL